MPNRLAREKSPYLLQHANNPVDWYPWGDEAFAKAKELDRPIFLSVGYSTCHWCHVMERESFENETIAAVLNQYFIPVKVDREERPDVDRIYMLFVQASTGSGGWPMSVWITPEGKPFYGGTYFPPDNRYGRPGFRAVLESLARAWNTDRERVEQSGAQVLEQLREYSGGEAAPGEITPESLDSAFHYFRRTFDSRRGGFGSAPKFPRPSVFNFLLRYYASARNEDALEMTLLTLREMAKGGMNDQLGGGFHRYSVDAHWFVPHFEKMLYDQAQLAVSYLEAFQITHDPQYAQSAREIFTYVLRDLQHPEGGFYSAEDADSILDPAHPHEKGEGAFYIWPAVELRGALGERDFTIFAHRYGVKDDGNVDEDPHGEFTGRNILYPAHTVVETAAYFETTVEQVQAALGRAIPKLLEIRSRRPRPHLDDKILVAWNALMISAFAKGAQVLEAPEYYRAARRAVEFLRTRLWGGGRLLRRYRDGEAAVNAFLDDHAFLIQALVDLYETGFDPADLQWAGELADHALDLFEDRQGGGFFGTQADQPDLVLRLKDDYDGAEPSGNSLMAVALLRLSRITGKVSYREAAERTLRSMAERMRTQGPAIPQMLVAQMFAVAAPTEIVLAGDREAQAPLLRVIRGRFLPNAVLMQAGEAAQPMPPVEGKPAVYICENFACQLPVTGPEELQKMLESAGQ